MINSSESISVLGSVAHFSGGIAGAVNLAKVGGVWGSLSAGSGGGSDEILGEFAASPGVDTTISGLGWDSWGSGDDITKWPSLDELFDGSSGGGGNESNNSGEFHFVFINF